MKTLMSFPLDAETILEIKDIIGFLDTEKMLGVAAPQVGIHKRFFVTFFNNVYNVYINPEIINYRCEKISQEGCLSFHNRKNDIDLFFYDIYGKPFIQEGINGLESILIQHEIDHLDGILINEIGIEI